MTNMEYSHSVPIWRTDMAYTNGDLEGSRIGQRTILRLVAHSTMKPQRPVMVEVRCDCGRQEIIGLPSMRKTQRCKACGSPDQKAAVTTHGGSRTPLYRTWRGMLDRCNGKGPSAQWYGDRGISVCEAWHDFSAYRAWAMSNGWQPGLSIDRRDPEDGYHPGNCEFVTVSENTRRMQERKHRFSRHYPIEMLWGHC